MGSPAAIQEFLTLGLQMGSAAVVDFGTVDWTFGDGPLHYELSDNKAHWTLGDGPLHWSFDR